LTPALDARRSAHWSSGWQPRHVAAYDSGSGKLLGGAPLYLKSHSYGEYVFDHSWARAYSAFSPEPYYPKLQSCVPFTPVTGPRLLAAGADEAESEWIRAALAQAVTQLCDTMGVSSAHVTFPAKSEWELMGKQKWVLRTGIQYHWNNRKWATFDDFLASLKQSKRKSIRSERNKVAKQGVTVHRLRGADITEAHWDAFYKFYTNTVDEHWGQAYLSRQFFSLLTRDMADDVLLIMAREEASGEWVAGALNLVGGDCIYGRNWGCTKQFNSLHFELCYYQAIEAAIEMGLDRVEAGAQGEHKIARGYLPSLTFSGARPARILPVPTAPSACNAGCRLT
jgi:predicted N-acyltransferase